MILHRRSRQRFGDRKSRWRRALAGVGFAALLVAIQAGGLARGERTSLGARYDGHNRCGVVDSYRPPPLTQIQADIDGNGRVEHYSATWGGVERHRQQEGSHPPTMVREAIVYSTQANHQYSCADLVAHDTDGDGDLDLVFGGHRELVFLENNNGRLSVSRREPQDHPAESDVRIRIRGSSVTLAAR